ncbi:Glutathione S-transferase U25 [Linum perenne]
MAKSDLVILDCWASPFCARVKLALTLKGLEFEARAEDLFGGKSELLLASNPVYKKVPVFLHDGEPVCESSIIVSYIDEKWPSMPLLPSSPYERSQARFWGDYIDKKVLIFCERVVSMQVFDSASGVWKASGEEAIEGAKKEFVEVLKVLEGGLGEKEYFGGEELGFVDVLGIPITTWFLASEKFGNFKVEDECPKLSAWIKRCMENEKVANSVPDPEKVYEFVINLRKMMGIS